MLEPGSQRENVPDAPPAPTAPDAPAAPLAVAGAREVSLERARFFGAGAGAPR